MIMSYRGKTPKIGRDVYIAPTAVIIGDVTLEDASSVWFNAVVRGDLAPITIGRGSNIQDNCTLHTDAGIPLSIGDSVTVGHNAVVHGCTVQSYALIGMNAVILNHAVIGEGSVVAAAALVREQQQIDPYSLVAGVPARIKKELASDGGSVNRGFAQEYMDLSVHYLEEHQPSSSDA